jgi:hypothetical protein
MWRLGAGVCSETGDGMTGTWLRGWRGEWTTDGLAWEKKTERKGTMDYGLWTMDHGTEIG